MVGVAGTKNVSWVKEALGADEVVDYHTQDWASLYSSPEQQFDIIVDTLGNTPERTAQVLGVLKPSGHYSYIQNFSTDFGRLTELLAAHEQGKKPSATNTLVKPDGAALEHLYGLWADGKLALEVAQVFPLREVAAAQAQVETGHTRGKVLLAIPQ